VRPVLLRSGEILRAGDVAGERGGNRRAFEAFAERGVDGFLEHLTEDVDHRAME
jgi:hypothetical protein